MDAFTFLHRTAMEFYDLAGIYKAKGQTDFLKDYQERAWLLEQEAALQVLAEPDDFTFKYVIVNSAGQLGYNIGAYEEAKRIVQLGLKGNPSKIYRHEMELLLQKINDNIADCHQEKPQIDEDVLEVSGTLTIANVQAQEIAVREQGREQLRYIKVSVDAIKKVLRFYLGEWVDLQLKKNHFGEFDVKYIGRGF
ncbi:MAG: hypothetical protein AAGI23_07150 [Bacteroidota bacterium]